MFHRLWPLCMVAALACTTKPVYQSPVLAPNCENTPVNVTDLEKFGFTTTPGKVVVARLFRISCPVCKEDLVRVGSYFQNGTWSKDKVQLYLIAYRKEGIENRKTFDTFMREELTQLGIPLEAVQVVYVDKDYYSLVKSKGSHGDLLFDGWRAVPFGLVFGRDGRLAYRGQFTISPGAEDQHYRFVTQLQNENCIAVK